MVLMFLKQGDADISGAACVGASPHQRTTSSVRRCQRGRKSRIKVRVWYHDSKYVQLTTLKSECLIYLPPQLLVCLF